MQQWITTNYHPKVNTTERRHSEITKVLCLQLHDYENQDD